MSQAPEQRTATVDVENVRTEGKTLHGFACLYGAESRDLGGFTERIEPGAFTDALAADPDVLLTFNHSPDKVLARTGLGTLKLADEQRGLAFEAQLGDGPTAQDVRDMVRRGDLSGASFRFKVAPDGERWDGEQRTLTKVDELIDVSLATTPAYDGPRVELRTRPDNPAAGGEGQDDGSRSRPKAAASLSRTGPRRTSNGRSTTRSSSSSATPSAAKPEPSPPSVGVSQAEISTSLFDKLRASSVFLSTGVNVISTDSRLDRVPAADRGRGTGRLRGGRGDHARRPDIATLTATPAQVRPPGAAVERVRGRQRPVDHRDPAPAPDRRPGAEARPRLLRGLGHPARDHRPEERVRDPDRDGGRLASPTSTGSPPRSRSSRPRTSPGRT